MGRTVVNVVGNYVAALAVAKLEGEFDHDRAMAFLGRPDCPPADVAVPATHLERTR
jgi:Na+/H+-dicarboxylate symporter